MKTKSAHLMLTLLLLSTLSAARAALNLNIAVEPVFDIGQADVLRRYQPLAKHLGSACAEEIRIVVSQNMTDQLRRMRSAEMPIVLGPAHVVADAMKHGYQAFATIGGDERMAIIVPKHSAIARFEDLKGKRLGLPPQDSIATYLYLGALNERGLVAKAFNSEIRYYRLHEVALYALGLGLIDAVAVDAAAGAQWAKKNGGKAIFESPPVPGPTLAFGKDLSEAKRTCLGKALLAGKPGNDGGLGAIAPARPEAYVFVSTLGHYTPSVLSGAKIVSAEEAMSLAGNGAILLDVRTEKEFRDAHPKGARHLPYKESSRKEVGFDKEQDRFELSEAIKDKNASLIFFCNGPGCWKAYKASVWALQAGYRNVYWFRGGYPEWRDKGLPLEKSSL